MIVSVRDKQTLSNVSPSQVAAYLRVKEWVRVAHEMGRYSIWAAPSSGSGTELLLPLDSRLGDYVERIADLLNELQRVEERSQTLILQDIETASCDTFRFGSNPSTGIPGTIPIEQGALFVGLVKDFLLYAATAEKSPERPSLLGKRAEKVESFIGSALLGQTEVGSFVVRAQVPVPGALSGDMFPELVKPSSEPFERRVGIRLMNILRQTKEAALEANQTSDFGPFRELLSIGGSVGFYKTISEAQAVSANSPLEVSCRWAPNRPLVGPAPQERVVFEPEIVHPLREAVRLLQPSEPSADVQLVGAVELLRQDPQEEILGELSLNAIVGGRVRKVHFFLERPDYDLAIRAFSERVPLAVTGDLVKQGKYWRLKAPYDVKLLENPEAEED